jgi:hypothetical protein
MYFGLTTPCVARATPGASSSRPSTIPTRSDSLRRSKMKRAIGSAYIPERPRCIPEGVVACLVSPSPAKRAPRRMTDGSSTSSAANSGLKGRVHTVAYVRLAWLSSDAALRQSSRQRKGKVRCPARPNFSSACTIASTRQTRKRCRHRDVIWANGLEGGYVYGHDGVNTYWTRQCSTMDTRAEPIGFSIGEARTVQVEVHLPARDLTGNLAVRHQGGSCLSDRGQPD